MLLPEFTYGTYKDVKARSTKLMRRLKQGESWESIFDSLPMIDTLTCPGWIVIDGPCPLINEGDMKNFHVYVIHDVIHRYWIYKSFDNIQYDVRDMIFYASLLRSWSVLSLISIHNSLLWGPCYEVFTKKELEYLKWKALLNACVEYWDEFSAEGKRYSTGTQEGHELWSLQLGIKRDLRKLNVPISFLRNPLPKDIGLSFISEWIDL